MGLALLALALLVTLGVAAPAVYEELRCCAYLGVKGSTSSRTVQKR
jgi:hypothetical protein